MDHRNFDALCAALAFAALSMRPEKGRDHPDLAKKLASNIKNICRSMVPDAFDAEDAALESDPSSNQTPSNRLIDRMVAVITHMLALYGRCDPDDLITRGFSAEDVKRYWLMAQALAHVELDLLAS